MTVVVHWVRHGSHDRLDRVLCGRMAGVSLGDIGRSEAAGTAERLGAEALSAVYSSPLERARETAEPIAAAAGVQVREDARLIEIDFGAWNGARFDDLAADPLWARWNSARSACRPPGGETMVEAQARAASFLEDMLDRHDGERVCAVSHSEVIKAALAHALGLAIDHYDRFDVDPASVSTVHLGDWGMKVAAINVRPH